MLTLVLFDLAVKTGSSVVAGPPEVDHLRPGLCPLCGKGKESKYSHLTDLKDEGARKKNAFFVERSFPVSAVHDFFSGDIFDFF